jgi:hypothetical protein
MVVIHNVPNFVLELLLIVIVIVIVTVIVIVIVNKAPAALTSMITTAVPHHDSYESESGAAVVDMPSPSSNTAIL